MPTNKSISELNSASVLHVGDLGVVVQEGATLNFEEQLLLDLVSASVSLGSLITYGTTTPIGGKNTDVYFKINSNQLYQKISGTWVVIYTFPTAIGTTFRYGAGVPANTLGADGDSYIDTLTGIFYRKTGTYTQVFSMATGPQGPRGSSVLNGTVNPTTEGANGDFYYNTATNTIFGPKDGAGWGSGTLLLVIPTMLRSGTVNPSNDQYNNGDYYINDSNYTFFGPKTSGVWPSGVSLIPPGVAQPAIIPFAATTALPIVFTGFQTSYSAFGRFPKFNAVRKIVNDDATITYDYLSGLSAKTIEVTPGLPDSVEIDVDNDGTNHIADNIILIITTT